MAIYPGAEYRPLGRQTEPAMSAHNILCFHTMVGSLAGTDNMFDDDGYYGTESHFGVGGSSDGKRDGHVIQWQDTTFGADANLDGKGDVISVETSDGGDPDQEWSPKQLDALVELGVWVCRTHSIPAVLIPDTKPGRRGIAYHRQGCDHSSSYRPEGWPYDAWRVPGGRRWSTVLGKVCPGDVRIRQLVDIVIPRIAARLRGAPSKPDSNHRIEDLMSHLHVPAGGESEKKLAFYPIALDPTRKWRVTIAPGVDRGVYIASMNTWKNQDEKVGKVSTSDPGGIGAVTKDCFIQEHAGRRFDIGEGVAKLDLAYWSDRAFSVQVVPR
ncbi:hypothetical protein BAY59_24250 [Prauserella coralliicola]|nr:hypothetical protein BAY59_24250 [Prauserella coralliicola]